MTPQQSIPLIGIVVARGIIQRVEMLLRAQTGGMDTHLEVAA